MKACQLNLTSFSKFEKRLHKKRVKNTSTEVNGKRKSSENLDFVLFIYKVL